AQPRFSRRSAHLLRQGAEPHASEQQRKSQAGPERLRRLWRSTTELARLRPGSVVPSCDGRSCPSSHVPPFPARVASSRSWMLAGWTAMPTSRPEVSVTTWRLRPLDLLGRIVAARPATFADVQWGILI